MRKGPWGQQPKQPDVPMKGSDEVKKEEAKLNGADKIEDKGEEEKKEGGDAKTGEKKDGGDAKSLAQSFGIS